MSDNNEIIYNQSNTIDFSPSERKTAIITIVVSAIGLLICIGLFTQVLITHKPVLFLEYSALKPEFKVLGSSYLILLVAGGLFSIIGLTLLTFFYLKRLGYILAFLGLILTLLSFWILFISYDFSLGALGYITMITIIIANNMNLIITKIFVKKQLPDFLKNIKNINFLIIFIAIIILLLLN